MARFAALALLVLLLAGAQGAANSDANSVLARSLVFDHSNTACAGVDGAGHLPSTATQTGIAFDGSRLLVSCWNDNTITAVSPSTGSEIAVYHITGGSAFGALAWDPVNHVLWACNGHESEVGVIDLSTSTYTKRFVARGCTDALAYDPADGTLWAGRDGGHTVATLEHYTQSGTLLGSVNVGNLVNDRSGVAVAGSRVFVASPHSGYPKHLWQTTRAFTTASVLATWTGGAKAEDLECDGSTFGTPVIWVNWNNQNLLQAYTIGGTCGPPSGAELTITQSPSATTMQADGQLGITSTISDLGPAAAANATVTWAVPKATLIASAVPSQGSCTVTSSAISCALGGIASGAYATVSVTMTPISPGQLTSTVTATSDVTPSPASDSVAVTVTPQPGTAYTQIADAGFSPATTKSALGGMVQWNFVGPGIHSVRDTSGLNLFDTGPVSPTAYRTTGYPGAGTFTVADGSSSATGSVAVAMSAPGTASLGSPISLTWAAGALPAGLVEDVQVQRPGQTTWVTFVNGAAGGSGTFTADAGAGTYKFRARLRNPQTGKASKYSSASAVNVA